MTEQHIVEGNQKIKRFHLEHVVESFHEDMVHETHDIMYNRSWDWLYPILKLIEKQGYEVSMGPTCCQIYDGEHRITYTDLQDGRLAGTWKAVLEFIDYYKTTK